jgi:hypothetical protein
MYMDDDTIFGVVLHMWDLEGERWRLSRSRLTMGQFNRCLQSQGWDRGVDEMKLVLDQCTSHKERLV